MSYNLPMLSARKNTPAPTQNPTVLEPDRLANAFFYTNELNISRLREITKAKNRRWTPEKRQAQSARARAQSLWKFSTGPKTDAGKYRSSLNAWKHGCRGATFQKLHAVLVEHKRWLRQIEDRARRTRKESRALQYMLERRMETLDEITRRVRLALEVAGVETPALDARLIVRRGAQKSESEMITGGSTPLSIQQVETIDKFLAARVAGAPVSRLWGGREFWGLDFKISPDTLDPRPDTETLVEAALKRARKQAPEFPAPTKHPLPEGEGKGEGLQSHLQTAIQHPHLSPPPKEGGLSLPPRHPIILNVGHEGIVASQVSPAPIPVIPALRGDPVKAPASKPLRILDLGTGSGCILIALLSELPGATGMGIDLSHGALMTARDNADALGVGNRAEFRLGSWFEPLNPGESFDLIVSNPPYIPDSDIESLAPEVRNHDPMLALAGGNDGLDAYKNILESLRNHLVCGGYALFEIGRGQEKDLARLVDDSHMRVSDSYADLAGVLRVVEITHGEK